MSNLDTAVSYDTWVTFRVANVHYGACVADIDEVLPDQRVTLVPGAPPHVLGIIHHLGQIITVVDGRGVFGDKLSVHDRRPCGQARILTLRGKSVGLLVDDVGDLAELDENALQAASGEWAPRLRRNIVGCVTCGNAPLVLIDLPSLVFQSVEASAGVAPSSQSTGHHNDNRSLAQSALSITTGSQMRGTETDRVGFGTH